MKPSSDLFQLIKSLSKSEKRFFKLSSSLQSGDKNYLRIFDAIDKQTTYDEEALKRQFKKEVFIKHFPSEKNHLYKLILKSLRAFHADDSVSSRLKQELKNIEILYKKALFRECNKFLSRAKKLAISHEKFYYHFELINLEKLLLEEAYEAGEFSRDLDELIREEQEVIAKLRNLAEYHVLYSKINYVFRSGGHVRSEEDRRLVEEIANHPLIAGKNTALSERAATICYYIQGFCAKASDDKKLAYAKFQRVKDILDNKPLIRKDLAKRYMRTLNNLLNLQIDQDQIDEALEMISFIRSLLEQPEFSSDDILIMAFKATYIAEMNIYRKLGAFDKALQKIKEVEEGLEEYQEKLNKEQQLLFQSNIAAVYFGAGQFREALKWINVILNDNESNLRQDLYSYARLFNLVIHYELGNYDLLEYVVKSTLRYLSRRRRDHQVELTVLNYMRRLAKAKKEGDDMQPMREFKEDLQLSLAEDSGHVVQNYFDFMLWIDSKLNQISFQDAAREKFQRITVSA